MRADAALVVFFVGERHALVASRMPARQSNGHVPNGRALVLFAAHRADEMLSEQALELVIRRLGVRFDQLVGLVDELVDEPAPVRLPQLDVELVDDVGEDLARQLFVVVLHVQLVIRLWVVMMSGRLEVKEPVEAEAVEVDAQLEMLDAALANEVPAVEQQRVELIKCRKSWANAGCDRLFFDSS